MILEVNHLLLNKHVKHNNHLLSSIAFQGLEVAMLFRK